MIPQTNLETSRTGKALIRIGSKHSGTGIGAIRHGIVVDSMHTKLARSVSNALSHIMTMMVLNDYFKRYDANYEM